MAEVDRDGRVRRWSAEAEALLGVDAIRAVGRVIDALPGAGEPILAWARARTTLERDGSYRSAGWWRGPDGARAWMDVGVAPAGTGPAGASASWTVCMRRLAPSGDSGAATTSDLEAARLVSLGSAAREVAHDLGNVFMAIECFAGLLERELPSNGAGRTVLRHLLGAAARGSRLSRGVLEVGRRRTGSQGADIDLATSVHGLAPILRTMTPPGVRLDVEFDSDLPPIRALERHVEVILLNLIANARDAIDGEGTIEVRAARTREGEPPGVRLAVRDSGSGIPEEVLDRVFEPGFTTKSEGRGTGLGLPMVLEAVRACGGRLEISSAARWGTVVEIFFESAEGPAIASIGGAGVGMRTVRQRPRVLISAVPGSQVAHPLELLLRRKGFAVVVVQQDRAGGVRDDPASPVDLLLVELPPTDVLADECRLGGGNARTLYLRPRAAGAWACRGTVLDLPCDPRDILDRIEGLFASSGHQDAVGLH